MTRIEEEIRAIRSSLRIGSLDAISAELTGSRIRVVFSSVSSPALGTAALLDTKIGGETGVFLVGVVVMVVIVVVVGA